jgi:phosphoribosylanthranilate isomerase
MTRVKICGIKCLADVMAVNETKPDYAGFVFAPSRRQVNAQKAACLHDALDKSIVSVGVFIDAPIGQVVRLYESGIINMAQLHGSENDDYLAELKTYGGLPLIKAFCLEAQRDATAIAGDGVVGAEDVATLATLFPHADYLLFDGHQPGSGKRFDWALLKDRAAINRPFFLAGGIDPTTVDAALELEPFCIDLSSGVETGGIKDARRIASVVQQAHRKGRI